MNNGYSDHHHADKPGEETPGKFNLNCTSCYPGDECNGT